MTIVQITTAPSVPQSATLQLVVVEPHAAAQAAGDAAYEIVRAAGLTPEEMADAYHVAYVEAAQDLGLRVPCACDFCANLHSDQASIGRLVERGWSEKRAAELVHDAKLGTH